MKNYFKRIFWGAMFAILAMLLYVLRMNGTFGDISNEFLLGLAGVSACILEWSAGLFGTFMFLDGALSLIQKVR